MRFVWLLLLLPTMAYAECAQWLLCPYRTPVNAPNLRYVAIDDYRPRIEWREIEVAGNRALVCLSQPKPDDLDEGCTNLNRGQIKALAVEPGEAYFENGVIKFSTTVKVPFNYDELRKRIRDTAVNRENFDRVRGPQQ